MLATLASTLGISADGFKRFVSLTSEDLGWFQPELVLIAVACVVILSDTVLTRRGSRHLAWVALGGGGPPLHLPAGGLRAGAAPG